MDLAAIISVHNNPDLARDTIDSVRCWATKQIVLIVDKAGWDLYRDFQHPDTKVVCGVFHNANRSPYKNMAIGLKNAYELYPNAKWYNYIEYDAIYTSDRFKLDLTAAGNAAAVGFDYVFKGDSTDNWIVKQIFNRDVECHKLLGAVTYYSNSCIRSFIEYNFFEELFKITATFQSADFPNFSEYAVEEIIFPSAASQFGEVKNLGIGMSRRYAVRFGDFIHPNEITPETSIVHPTKGLDCPIRQHYAKQRELFLC